MHQSGFQAPQARGHSGPSHCCSKSPKNKKIHPEDHEFSKGGVVNTVSSDFSVKLKKGLVYLPQIAISNAGLDNWVYSKSGWFEAKKIHVAVVTRLRSLPPPKLNVHGSYQTPPQFVSFIDQQLFDNIKLAAEEALKMAMEYFRAQLLGIPIFEYAEVDENIYQQRLIAASLLHGKNCKLWKKEECIDSGTLMFDDFRTFTIENESGITRAYDISDKDARSGKFRIEEWEAEEMEELIKSFEIVED